MRSTAAVRSGPSSIPAELVLDPEFDVAAELECRCRAPAMLVAIGDRADAAGLGDDMRFLLVIAGVQDLVADALPLQEFGSISDFSIDTVPTRIGCPLACFSWIALVIAANLSSWFL
jgi:hypothetical protein